MNQRVEISNRTWSNLADLAVCNALLHLLQYDDDVRAREIASAALDRGDALHYQLARALLSFGSYARVASTEAILPSLDPSWSEPPLSRYLRARNLRWLFPAQVRALRTGTFLEGSQLVAMPTSSGKTLLAEFRIAHELRRNHGARVVYLAPYRLLARQVERKLRGGLRSLKLSVQDLGGDFDTEFEEGLAPEELPDVAVMTPERMDAILRLSTTENDGSDQARQLLNSMSLLVLDEAHLVGRPGRGARLELFLSRLRSVRGGFSIVALSAATQEASNLAGWLQAGEVSGGGRPTGTVELLWRTDGDLVQRFEGKIARVTTLEREPTAIASAAKLADAFRFEVAPVLIVETTRDYAESVIVRLAERDPRAGDRWRNHLTPDSVRLLDWAAEEAESTLGEGSPLPRLIQQGLAYHHAGLPTNLLRSIEDLARQRALRVLGATTTVAEGADLPFQVVIIPHLNFQGGSRRLGA